MVPIGGRASSFLEFLFFCMYVNRKEEEEGETEQQLQSYQFIQGYITLHRLQGHHLTLTCIIHNQYNYVNYIHTINIMNCSIHNAFYQLIFKVYVFRLVYIKKNDRSRQEFIFPERTIYGVYLLEVALKTASSHTIHTTVTFQAFRRLTITCLQVANVLL